jgi:hypothetical protein
MFMLLSKGQVVTFKGRDGIARAAEFARELCGRGEQIGNAVRVTHLTYLKPNLAAEVPQFSFHDSARECVGNGQHDAIRL